MRHDGTNAKVCDLHAAFSRDQQVCRFQVTVDNAVLVGEGYSASGHP
jgi:hypothetical protein